MCLFQSLSDVQFAFCINLVDLILCVFSFYDTRGHYLFSYKQRGIISHADSPGAGVFTDPCCNLNICYISHIIIPEKNIFEKKFLLCDEKKISLKISFLNILLDWQLTYSSDSDTQLSMSIKQGDTVSPSCTVSTGTCKEISSNLLGFHRFMLSWVV